MSNPENMGEKELLNKAIGGWRGLIDSALPSMLFIVIFVFQKNLNNALIASLALGAVLLVIRLIERKSLTQVFSGFLGLSISVFLTWRTKDASIDTKAINWLSSWIFSGGHFRLVKTSTLGSRLHNSYLVVGGSFWLEIISANSFVFE